MTAQPRPAEVPRRLRLDHASEAAILRSLLLLSTLAGFILRAWALDAKDLRGDEGFAAVFAAQPLPAVWAALGQSEPHPPLYYVLLHATILAAGPSSYALRFPSLLFGALAVPALALAAWQALGRRAALLVAALTALNPLLVWQAQDARMYAQLVGCSALALAGAAAVARGGRVTGERRFALLAGITGALLTHYFAMLLALGLSTGLALARCLHQRGAKPTGWWIIVAPTLAALLIALPLALHGRQALTGHPAFAALSIPALLRDAGLTVAGGFTTPLPARSLVGSAALALAPFGLLGAARRRPAPAAFLTGALLVPVLGFALLELRYPAYQSTYAALLAPAWLLAIAGVAALPAMAGRISSAAIASLAGGLAVVALVTYAHVGKGQSWRQAAALLQAQGQPGDVVVLNYPDPTLRWVYIRQDGGALPVALLPAAQPVDHATLDRAMIDLAGRYGRVWFWTLRTAAWDPRHQVEVWLDRHALPLRTVDAGDVQFRLFETPGGFLRSTPALPAGTFARQVRLAGATWTPHDASPGGALEVELCWQAVAPPAADYTAFVHLERAGSLAAQDDHPPVGGLNPTHTWLTGESFLDHFHLALPSSLAPGPYTLHVGLYDSRTLQRLPVLDASDAPLGDALTIGALEVR